ncbi:hypothetical protein [Paraburkholderia oxyphila]|uniref:hypothetical protein n=1 Tax=Paraburkholderia oxyphila TaxID=614212 RepID=UPI0012ED76FA|nr:hypothetical protein [Paraburkholderia oxyphila]
MMASRQKSRDNVLELRTQGTRSLTVRHRIMLAFGASGTAATMVIAVAAAALRKNPAEFPTLALQIEAAIGALLLIGPPHRFARPGQAAPASLSPSRHVWSWAQYEQIRSLRVEGISYKTRKAQRQSVV